jgi:hypothetical protein
MTTSDEPANDASASLVSDVSGTTSASVNGANAENLRANFSVFGLAFGDDWV